MGHEKVKVVGIVGRVMMKGKEREGKKRWDSNGKSQKTWWEGWALVISPVCLHTSFFLSTIWLGDSAPYRWWVINWEIWNFHVHRLEWRPPFGSLPADHHQSHPLPSLVNLFFELHLFHTACPNSINHVGGFIRSWGQMLNDRHINIKSMSNFSTFIWME